MKRLGRRLALVAGVVIPLAVACDAGTVIIGLAEAPDAGVKPGSGNPSDGSILWPPNFDGSFDASYGPCFPDGGCPAGFYCREDDGSTTLSGNPPIDAASIEGGTEAGSGGPIAVPPPAPGECYLMPGTGP
ncbi:MAG TPA: hypothetical protein VGI39_19640 [Polyangiaceae bacterium]|jgi:hypothetical protein